MQSNNTKLFNYNQKLAKLRRHKSRVLYLAAAAAVMAGCAGGGSANPPAASAKETAVEHVKDHWYQEMQADLANSSAHFAAINNQSGAAKNVILFVGDGMGLSTVTASRIRAGQKLGKTGEEYQLSFEKFPFSGLMKTYNVDAQTPDSAGTMTAMMSGVKTNSGVIGVGEKTVRSDCQSQQGNELTTMLELAELAGKATGIISTARITHATPAATYAKTAERNWEATAPAGCVDIASQLVHFKENLQKRYPNNHNIDGLEVVLGGGRRNFLPQGKGSKRKDDVNLIQTWQKLYPQGVYVENEQQFNAIGSAAKPIFGLFNASHMQYESDRHNDKDGGEPSLSAMTQKAIAHLKQNPNGFFLMVESGRIDHAHHAGNAYNALEDTIEYANAVQKAFENTDPKDTLIIVTADHSHVFTIAGYPKRGNPILGKVVSVGQDKPALAEDKMPYTTLGYTNGRGFMDLGSITNADVSYSKPINTGRQDLSAVNTTSAGFHQEALVPLSSETHAGEDVGAWASGPGAHLLTGTHEQSILFHVMNRAAAMDAKAAAAK